MPNQQPDYRGISDLCISYAEVGARLVVSLRDAEGTFDVLKQMIVLSPIIGALVQLVRILACHASGHRFEPGTHRQVLRVSYNGNTSAFQADARSSILLSRSTRP